MTSGHGQCQWPLWPSGHVQWPWPMGMAHGQCPWPMAFYYYHSVEIASPSVEQLPTESGNQTAAYQSHYKDNIQREISGQRTRTTERTTPRTKKRTTETREHGGEETAQSTKGHRCKPFSPKTPENRKTHQARNLTKTRRNFRHFPLSHGRPDTPTTQKCDLPSRHFRHELPCEFP